MRCRPMLVGAAALFGVQLALARGLGIRFDMSGLGRFWQILDERILRQDLLRGLWDLHAQPPLFNLIVGLGLKTAPAHAATLFAPIFGLSGLLLLLALGWLLARIGLPVALGLALLAAFALHPSFLVYEHWLFYTFPVAAWVALALVFLWRFVESGRWGWGHAFALTLLAIMMTRAAFHPLWLIGAGGLVALRLAPPLRARLLLALLTPLLLTCAWYGKNRALVGSFSGSSWAGMNLANGWDELVSRDETARLVAAGALPEVFGPGPFQPPDRYAPLGYFAALPPAPPGHPALDAAWKSNGQPNFNHRDYARISRAMSAGVARLARLFPARALRRFVWSVYYYAQPGPNSTGNFVGYDFGPVARLRDGWTRFVFFGWRVRPGHRESPNLLLVLLPALLLFGLGRTARGLGRGGAGGTPVWAVTAFASATLLFCAIVVNVVENGENDRLRWETEPLWIFLGALALARLAAAVRRRPPT